MEIALHKLSVSRGKVTTLRIRNVNVQRNLNKGGESGLVCPQKTILHVVLARCLHYLCHLLHERSWQLATGNWCIAAQARSTPGGPLHITTYYYYWYFAFSFRHFLYRFRVL